MSGPAIPHGGAEPVTCMQTVSLSLQPGAFEPVTIILYVLAVRLLTVNVAVPLLFPLKLTSLPIADPSALVIVNE